ncbi:hypothetical protein EL06_28315 [Salmonella enterica subsp. diarizonae]|uniref:Uncharacterized protein n=1 Tax=Salmonella diarizonae TaxID=59204 RepID=A0A6C8Y852_SALDZ|nr:hypothetical protein [Salmonella enterica subsp. diarizonae]
MIIFNKQVRRLIYLALQTEHPVYIYPEPDEVVICIGASYISINIDCSGDLILFRGYYNYEHDGYYLTLDNFKLLLSTPFRE